MHLIAEQPDQWPVHFGPRGCTKLTVLLQSSSASTQYLQAIPNL